MSTLLQSGTLLWKLQVRSMVVNFSTYNTVHVETEFCYTEFFFDDFCR